MADAPGERSRIIKNPEWRHAIVLTVSAIVILLLAYRLSSIITPLLFSFALAYILDPFIDWLVAKGLPRLIIVIAVYVFLFVAVVLIVLLVIPQLIVQVFALAQWLMMQSLELQRYLKEHHTQLAEWLIPQIERLVETYSVRAAQTAFEWLFAFLGSAFNLVTLSILIPVYTFFFLWRFDEIGPIGVKFLPKKHKTRIIDVVNQINIIVANFFRGRLIVSLVVGLLTSIGFVIVGVPFAWPLGLGIGVLNLVPYLAPIVGLPPVLIISYVFSQTWILPLYALAVFTFAQAVDNFLLTPVIQRRMVGLHPITTIVVLFIGADLAGMFGLILAVPAAAAIKIIFSEFAWPQIAEATDIDINAIKKTCDVEVEKEIEKEDEK